jgi:tetratricopeptide (TPR) repeat protein
LTVAILEDAKAHWLSKKFTDSDLEGRLQNSGLDFTMLAYAFKSKTLPFDPRAPSYGHGQGWYQFGEYLLDTERTTEAIKLFHNILKRAPDDLNASLGLAQALVQTRQISEALNLYRQLNDKFPDNHMVQRGLVVALRNTGKEGEADALEERLSQRYHVSDASAR